MQELKIDPRHGRYWVCRAATSCAGCGRWALRPSLTEQRVRGRVPVRTVAVRQHGEDARRRERFGQEAARTQTRIAIAAMRPAQQLPAAHRKDLVVEDEHGGVRQAIDRQGAAPLLASIQSLGVEHAIHLGGARTRRAVDRGGPAGSERQRVAAPAFEARPVAGRKRGRLVEEEELGIALAPDRAMASLELRYAADPGARRPPPRAERAVVAMNPAAA